MRRILIVEDDEVMALALRDGLESEGYQVEIANDGQTGLQAAGGKGLDLVILDVMLPRLCGIDVCRQLRSGGNNVPIIMLTARGQEVEKVYGLRAGADDYITKPFSLMEFLARIAALLRRTSRPAHDEDGYTFGDVVLDFRRYEATKGGAPLELSPREFRMLKYLVEHRGEVVTRDQLLESVWSSDLFPTTRTIDTHVAKVRQKIEETPGSPRYILTVHGVGYKFNG